MKLKFNKACDLSSISVLPPATRRSTSVTNGSESSSVFGVGQMMSQNHYQQPQQSQQTFSQGLSSQHGLLSQFSQNSQDEILTNERNGSQDRDLSIRRTSCLPPISCTREENQTIVCRTNSNLMRKWSSQENKCQVSEDLEHKIGLMETSVSRLGMILDSVQSDVMQVCRRTKEMSLETEGVRQKLMVYDDSLQSMLKGQDELKARLDKETKLLFDQFKQTMNSEHFAEIISLLSALSNKLDIQMSRFQNEVMKILQREIQVACRSMKIHEKKQETSAMHITEAVVRTSPQNLQNSKKFATKASTSSLSRHVSGQQVLQIPKNEAEGWRTVKKKGTFNFRSNEDESSSIRTSRNQVEQRVVIDSDEDIDGGFSCLLQENETVAYSTVEAEEETARILRKARRRKRKHCNTIIIN